MADNQYKVALGVDVDTSDLQTQIDGAKVKPIQIDIDLKHTQQQIDIIKSQIESLNDIKIKIDLGSGASGSTNGIKQAANEIKNIQALAKKIGNLEVKIGKLDTKSNVNQIKELERQLKLLKIQYDQTVKDLNAKGIEGFGGAVAKEFVEARNKLAEFEAKLTDTKSQLAKNIKSNIGTSIKNEIDKVHSDFNKLSTQSDKLKQKLDLINSIKIDLDTASANNDIEGLINANERLETILKDVKSQININQIAERDALSGQSFTLDKEKAMLRLKSLFGENSEAAKKFASDLDRIQREIRECGSESGLKLINKDIDVLGRKVKEADVQTQTFGQRLKHQFQQYSSYLSVASIFSYASQGLRDMFEQVKLIDSAMTELKKVTNETDATYNKFLTNAADRAKAIGTTIDGLVSSTADFARLGYGFEDAQGLAEVANIYAVVGDEIEGVEGATESLISTMAAFKDEMNGMSNTDFAMSIIDKFNEIGKLIA